MTSKTYNMYTYNFLIPGMLIYGVFFIIPTFLSFYFSFTNWGLNGASYVGFSNFKELLSDSTLNICFKNTFLFTAIVTVFKMGLGLMLALLLNMRLKSQGFLRTVFYFPVILSSVAAGLIFSSIYHPTTGLINRFLASIGMDMLARDWLGDLKLVMYSVSFIEIWKWTGFAMVIFLAGLQSIPKEYYEAIDIDGANNFQKFRYVTFPMLGSAINSNLLFCLIGGLRVFDIVYVATGGGPGTASEVIQSLVYKKFTQGYFGLSTAGGLMLFILVSVIVFPIYMYISKKEVEV